MTGTGDEGGFADVDAADAARLVAMMEATDAWPAVQQARAWVLDAAGVGPGSTVVDVGSGTGAFARSARRRGAAAVDLDRAAAMLATSAARATGGAAARADAAGLPFASASVDLVHCERVLQWSAEPDRALDELVRVAGPEGWVAVTDTDWGTFVVDHPDPATAARWSAAALRWVPHPTLARTLARRLGDLGARSTIVRADVVTIESWDPDDPAQDRGPLGLPLLDIAAAGDASAAFGFDALAELARAGRFFACLTLVTCLAGPTDVALG